MLEILEILTRIIDDNNYLPGHPEVIVAITLEDFAKIEEVVYEYINGENSR